MPYQNLIDVYFDNGGSYAFVQKHRADLTSQWEARS